jgi:2-polyprenyl-3-methyl-5-hydroxy-6-metoxy-1,4-benzoquinol methylase
MPTTAANAEVLEFYRVMPFNYMDSASAQAAVIRQHNNLRPHYPILEPRLKPGVRILDVGCGTGWLAHTLAWHYRADVTGIDFNPVAIARAEEIAVALGLDVNFLTADLFEYTPPQAFDVVMSLGVLHHTNDCLAGIKRCAEQFLAPDGTLFLGLYHAFGRAPFLEAVAARKRMGNSEEELWDYYANLSPNDRTDPVFLRSWFRDQVLHPHETQHTLAEIIPLLEGCGLGLEATSINDFAPVAALDDLYEKERGLRGIAELKLACNEFYPGFFVVMARKKSWS